VTPQPAGRPTPPAEQHAPTGGHGAGASATPDDDPIFIALGHRCSSAGMLDHCGRSRPSLPFDSIVCQLGVVRDCLENGFGAFLDPGNYVSTSTVTVNIIDDVIEHCCNEMPNVNRHYRDAGKSGGTREFVDASTYHQQLALTHHDLSSAEHREAFVRRIQRLHDLLAQDRRKVCVYLHPIMGANDFDRERGALVDLFVDFSEFMHKRSPGTFGLFFVLVKSGDTAAAERSVPIQANDRCSIHVIHANRHFIDAGGPFSGDCAREMAAIARIIEEQGPAPDRRKV
jgi:hypothetical protein